MQNRLINVRNNVLSMVLGEKLDEDLALIGELLALVPENSEDWRPDWPTANGKEPFTLAQLAAHLVDAAAALGACLQRLRPDQLQHFDRFREDIALAKNMTCSEAVLYVLECRQLLKKGFALVRDEQLQEAIPTYFRPEGEIWLSVLLSNWKHTNHHAYQLFLYLKLLGVSVSTKELYRFSSG